MKFLRLCFVFIILAAVSGCGPTYPKETLGESIVKLCKEEYGIDIKSKVIGNTLAIFIPLPSLLDVTLGMNKEAQEMIQDVLLSTSRVVLSTDAPVEFYCVIAQDKRLPELQVIVMKYVDDVKRAFFYDISRGEYFKRTIFDININPQSRKEQPIRDIIRKEYNVSPELEEEVLNKFFRSEPLALKDFGYWQNRFYVKKITLPEFLAEQMAYRIKMRFREDKELRKKFLVKAVIGAYSKKEPEVFFSFNFDIKMNEVLKVLGEDVDKRVVFENVFREISDCLYGYKFDKFDLVRIIDKNTGDKLFVSRDDIYSFKKKQVAIDGILSGI